MPSIGMVQIMDSLAVDADLEEGARKYTGPSSDSVKHDRPLGLDGQRKQLALAGNA